MTTEPNVSFPPINYSAELLKSLFFCKAIRVNLILMLEKGNLYSMSFPLELPYYKLVTVTHTFQYHNKITR